MTKVLFAAALCAVTAFAQPNFSGEWKLDIARSDFGQIPAPEVLTRSIKHQEPSLDYITYQKGRQGEVTSEIKYTTDGKPCVNKVQDKEAKGTARWVGENLLIEYTIDLGSVQVSAKEIWTLGDGGKTLTISNHISIPQQGEYDRKLVLDKQ